MTRAGDTMRNTWVCSKPISLALRIGALWFAVLAGAPPSEAQSCAGDCDGDGSLNVAELQTGIGIALGETPTAACPALDVDGNGLVRTSELTQAIGARIDGCAAASPSTGGPRGGAGAVLRIGSATGLPGTTVSFGVTLESTDEDVAGVENVIAFTANTRVRATGSGNPDCLVNPAINKNGTAFAFQPPGCSPGVDCTRMKALVLSLNNVTPIPAGSLLYTCTVAIAPAAPEGTYPLDGSDAFSSDPDGREVATDIVDGSITVGTPPTTTPTPPVVVDAPASLILRRAKLRASVGIRLGRSLGIAQLDAAVDTNQPFGGLADDIQASGLAIGVSTSGTSINLSWDATACSVSSTSRGPKIRCAADDPGGSRRTVILRPTQTPNVFTLKLFARYLPLRPPLATDAVQVTLSTARFRRPDEIGGCVVKGSQSDRKSCHEVGIIATPTPSATATRTATQSGTATRTASRTRTVTPTRTATGTATTTPTPTITRTPTPVVVPTVALGQRVFTIEPGVSFAMPDVTRTGLFSSIISGGNAAVAFSSGPLTLVGGLPDASGVAPLSLLEDVTLTVSVADGSYVCIKYVAAGSSGSIDCDGGTAYDVEATQPAGDVGFAFDLQTGLGAPAAPGNGALLVMQVSQQVPAGPMPDCATITYDDPGQLFGYTTTTATAIKGSLQLAVNGEAFSCNDFATPGSGGMLAAPAPTTATAFGDSANVFRLAEVGSERVFEIAPGAGFALPAGSGTGLFVSLLGGQNVASMFGPGPLTLVRGVPDANGVAPLRLKSDVTVPVEFIFGSCLCLRLLAEGSVGSIDCDGGTAYDTSATRAESAPASAWTVQTDLGVPAGTGNANLLVDGLFAEVSQSCSTVDCENLAYSNPPALFAFTTTTATAVQEPSTILAVAGAPFDCTNFTTSGSGGMLAAPVPTSFDSIGPMATVFRLAEAP